MVLFILTITVLLVGFIALWKRMRDQALLESFYEAILKEPMNSPESIQCAAQLWWNLGYTLNGMGKRDKAWLCVERLQSLDSEMAELLRCGRSNIRILRVSLKCSNGKSWGVA